jgi:hypothetical protein
MLKEITRNWVAYLEGGFFGVFWFGELLTVFV